MAKIVTSRQELVAVSERLKAVLSRPDGSDVWVYADGWSDEKVAKEVAPRLMTYHVAAIRLDLYGEISKRGKAIDVDQRVKRLELLVAELYARLGERPPE